MGGARMGLELMIGRFNDFHDCGMFLGFQLSNVY